MNKIMSFIDKHWKKDHILSYHKELFMYEFQNEDNLNIVISVSEEDEIEAMLGFIPYSKINRDSMLSIWKANKTSNPMLGIELLKFAEKETDSRLIASVGINTRVKRIYEMLGMETGKLTQWYRLGRINNFQVARIKDNFIPQIQTKQNKIKKFDTFEQLVQEFDFEAYALSNPLPYKEAWYIEKRYFNNPIYNYDVYGVIEEGKCNTLLIFRKQAYKDILVYRFVDVIGDYTKVYSATEDLDKIIEKNGAEYVDFYEKGMDSVQMELAGWLKVEDSMNLIPNYFSPFVQENIDLLYFSSVVGIYLFKGDGDQDRPN